MHQTVDLEQEDDEDGLFFFLEEENPGEWAISTNMDDDTISRLVSDFIARGARRS